jgi:hypothetical protein
MGGFVVRDRDTKQCFISKPKEIEHYLHIGQISITRKEILDRSKGDALTKGLVLFQTSWFILQIIARAIKHLPITELEIATLAFAALNGATYALWWHKPLDVECPIIVADLPQLVDAGVVDGSIHHEPVRDGDRVGVVRLHSEGSDLIKAGDFDAHNLLFIDAEAGSTNSLHRVPVGHSRRRETIVSILNRKFVYYLFFSAIGALFGGVHCIAWSFHYPTAPEKLVWQISSIITITLPLVVLAGVQGDFVVKLAGKIFRLLRVDVGGWVKGIPNVMFIAFAVLYSLARIALLVIAFTTLRSLPPNAYTTVHWTTFIPHI